MPTTPLPAPPIPPAPTPSPEETLDFGLRELAALNRIAAATEHAAQTNEAILAILTRVFK
jgi:hypothetical protein